MVVGAFRNVPGDTSGKQYLSSLYVQIHLDGQFTIEQAGDLDTSDMIVMTAEQARQLRDALDELLKPEPSAHGSVS